MTSTARFLSVCCLGVVVGLGALSACDKTTEITTALTSESAGKEGTKDESVPLDPTDHTAVYEKERRLRVQLNRCRNYVMGESSKPTDLDGVKKVCNEKKSPIPDKDPWGNALVYEPDPAGGNNFRLFSAGPDGQPNTPDDIHHSPDKIR
jgi:hypothetical protein